MHTLPGRHELGQNFLTDRRVIDRIVHLARRGPGDLVEWAAGSGALTVPLAAVGRPLEAVEIDPRLVPALRRRLPRHARVVHDDLLRYSLPPGSTLVSNLPYHLTTPALRHLLHQPGWDTAILIVQWEVARKRAGVGGTTQLTAQHWPWYEFSLEGRIPARAFRPMPSVDSGILRIRRRGEPLVPPRDRARYQRFVARVFTGRGRGLAQILQGAGIGHRDAAAFVRRRDLHTALPRDLDAGQWAEAFTLMKR